MKLLTCLMVVLLPLFVHAESYFIDQTRGASYEQGEAFKELIRAELRDQRADIAVTAEQSGWILEPSLLKLEKTYIVSLSKAKKGRVHYTKKLKLKSFDELDVVTKRLVKVVLRNEHADSPQQKEKRQKDAAWTGKQINVVKQFYLGFGPASLRGLEANAGAVNATAGYLWGLDSNFGFRLGLDWIWGEGKADFLSLGIGGQYYFNLEKHAPYLLGTVGFSWAEANVPETSCSNVLFSCGGEDKAGWAAQLGLGVHFFRRSKVNLALETVYTFNSYKVLDSRPGVFVGRILLFW